MHDSPAPAQAKNEAASLIKRFWDKLVGPSNDEHEVKAVSTPVVEKVSAVEESQPSRSRNNRRGRGQGQKSGEPRANRHNQERNIAPEVNKESKENQDVIENKEPAENKEPRANRNMRGKGRNVRRNLAPANIAADETAQFVATEAVPVKETAVPEAILGSTDVSVATDEQSRPDKKNNTRRGPNRRRPRNPNYKRVEGEGESDSNDGETNQASTDEARTAPVTSYDSDFAQRVERAERSEPQTSISVPSAPEPVVKVVEAFKPDAGTE
jgi:ribonuclease E